MKREKKERETGREGGSEGEREIGIEIHRVLSKTIS
jgi:hypothetical protein